MADYEPWSRDRAQQIIADLATTEGASLPILHALQATFGCVPLDAEPMVAAALNLTRAEVHGIVTFYHEFRRTPPGSARAARVPRGSLPVGWGRRIGCPSTVCRWRSTGMTRRPTAR